MRTIIVDIVFFVIVLIMVMNGIGTSSSGNYTDRENK